MRSIEWIRITGFFFQQKIDHFDIQIFVTRDDYSGFFLVFFFPLVAPINLHTVDGQVISHAVILCISTVKWWQHRLAMRSWMAHPMLNDSNVTANHCNYKWNRSKITYINRKYQIVDFNRKKLEIINYQWILLNYFINYDFK